MSSSGNDRRTFLRQSALVGGAVLGGAALTGAKAAPLPAAGPAVGPEQRVRELGLRLPDPVRTAGEQAPPIVPAVRVGNLLYTSGQGPRREEGGWVTGKVGADLSVDEGYEAARLAGLVTLAVLRNQLGSLDNVARVVKVLGMVNSAPDLTQQPRVINGFSELLIEVFGERGRGARSAVGVASLPGNWAVEVEAIFEIAE